jgi:microcystin-dependent protein
MATVTAYTAARMKAIEDATIVGGTVSGDSLVLIRHDGGQVDAGDVRGPQGSQGPGGGDISDVMELLCPVGTIVPFGGSVEPVGWKICDGSSLLRANYSALFNAIAVNFGSIDSYHFNLPDLREKVPIGKALTGTRNAVGVTGGNKDATLPAHTHTHTHAITVVAGGAHSHTVDGDGGARVIITRESAWSLGSGGTQVTATNIDPVGDHGHAAYSDYNAQQTGVSPTDANLQPYVVINYIIRY